MNHHPHSESMQSSHPTSSVKLLRSALAANALFSALCGLLLSLAASDVARALGLGPGHLGGDPGLALRLVGVGLLPFAAFVARQALRPQPVLAEARLTSMLDLGWVGGSALLWALVELPSPFVVALDLVALAVLGFAALQWLGIRRLTGSAHYDAVTPSAG